MNLRPFFLSMVVAISVLQFSCEHHDKAPWLTGFSKPPQNPVLLADSTFLFKDPVTGDSVKWQKADVFNPAAIVRNDTIFLLFRAEDNPKAAIGGRVSRIGLAYSMNGIDFEKHSLPVLYPDTTADSNWDYPGGVEDPRIVESPDGSYVMTYTSWDYTTARISVATSNDLYHWEKRGLAFENAHNGKFIDFWSKSASIVTKLENGRLIATKIKGKYWMYWGELFVHLATSEDLIHWEPVLDKQGELLKAMKPRLKQFDSHLTEPGPPAILTEEGILLLYNGKNLENENAAPNIPKGMYSGGQALFDRNDPTHFLERMNSPFIRPDLQHEITGQYKAGTTFIEGLVYFNDQWFLYYGTADSMVGLAIKK